jgi:hypothetical protein
MKKIVFLLIMPFCSHAQNNIIKTNLMGLAIKNYNITYERSLARVLSFSIGVRHMPKSSVPLKSQIEKFFAFFKLKLLFQIEKVINK